MSVVYEPRGKAKEYCGLAVNLFHGCDHGCKYCYAPAATYKTREAFGQVHVRPGIIEQIAKEAPSYKGREVLLSFTCDVYSSFACGTDITRQAIEALHAGGCRVTILTKGGVRSARDFDLLRKGDKYGATLTFIDPKDSEEWEPGAAPPAGRFQALKLAHDRGIFTWASLEPVIDPEQTLEIIRRTHEYVDLYKVGRWNHDKRAHGINWTKFGEEAIDLLTSLRKEFMVKKDLLRYLETVEK